MKKTNQLLPAVILLLLLFAVLAKAEPSVMHPGFIMLDENGKNVLKSGLPVSPMKTCGSCHDSEYVAQHNYHSDMGFKELTQPAKNFRGYSWELGTGWFGKWSPLTYQRLSGIDDSDIDMGTVDWILNFGAYHTGGGPAWFGQKKKYLTDYTRFDTDNLETSYEDPKTGQRKSWNWHQSGVIEQNCFLCHLAQPDNDARIAEIQNHRFKWVNTATLAKTGIVKKTGNGWQWNQNAFNKEGSLKKEYITIQDPGIQNCNICHKMGDESIVNQLSESGSFQYESVTGVVFASDHIKNSQLNVKNKKNLSRSWDIHAERMFDCDSCHFSINNPKFYTESDRTRPKHLIFDGRKMSIGEYLHRPSHKLANMRIRHEIENSEPDNVIQRCESCHDPYVGHDFLPYKKRHIWALGCESCHIPKLYYPALQQIDWTVLNEQGEPIKQQRGLETGNSEKNLISSGYEPVWLTRNLADRSCLLPYNLVTSSFWVDGKTNIPVKKSILTKAFLDNSGYHQEILTVLDTNKDGKLQTSENRLDTPEKVEVIKQKLAALGVSDPKIEAEIRPFSIHHGVTGRKGAIKDCYECHGTNSRFTKEIVLASFIPNNIIPEQAPNSFVNLEGDIVYNNDGSLVFHPRPKERGLYLFGKYRNTWVDIIGLLSILGVLFGITVHGGIRIVASRKIPHAKAKLTRVYMYPVYERLWHWLQAASIIVFIITGLEIHFADKFAVLGYETAVRIHEIIAFVFIGNAFLSIAYHITAGEIKNYLPQPKSFIDESWRQVIYYVKGIFQGAKHPIEKTPERRLNPIQQVTYLGILYALIPFQLVTGILIWGAEIWPNFLETIGGLSIIAPLHTLGAWFFVSFLIMHIYMTTTGHTPLANMAAMVTGWEDVELKESSNK